MKQEAYILLWLLGLACLGVLLHQLGEPEVWRHVVMMGWGYVPIIGITLAAYVNNVFAWRESFDGGTERPRLRPLLWVKLVGEALGNVMPASQIGKEVAKVMMLRERMGVTAGVSSLVLTKTGEMVSGVLFVLGGVLAGLHRYVFPAEIQWALFAALTIAVVGAVLTVVRQRRDPFTGLVNLVARMRISFVARFRNRAAEIDRNLAAFYRLKGWRLAGLLGMHLTTWGLGTLEIYVILHVLGEPMPFVSVYLFHSLMMVINVVFGFVPYGMGVFEGGHVFLFHLMGLEPGTGLAVGIVRRIRKIFWMLLGLLLLLLGSRTIRLRTPKEKDGLERVETTASLHHGQAP
ncbi:MAG: flippase-like domain-containing protein [Gemmatimonadota bacterium]|nr:flippase-like domain-containing protein [Gemmatimonadota bacterium]